MAKRTSFTTKVLREISKPPKSEAMIASDLRVTVPSVKRVVDTLVKYGRVERDEQEDGYPPILRLTRDGLDLLREQEPNWWQHRSDVSLAPGTRRG